MMTGLLWRVRVSESDEPEPQPPRLAVPPAAGPGSRQPGSLAVRVTVPGRRRPRAASWGRDHDTRPVTVTVTVTVTADAPPGPPVVRRRSLASSLDLGRSSALKLLTRPGLGLQARSHRRSEFGQLPRAAAAAPQTGSASRIRRGRARRQYHPHRDRDDASGGRGPVCPSPSAADACRPSESRRLGQDSKQLRVRTCGQVAPAFRARPCRRAVRVLPGVGNTDAAAGRAGRASVLQLMEEAVDVATEPHAGARRRRRSHRAGGARRPACKR
jgi:hypothetical protein